MRPDSLNANAYRCAGEGGRCQVGSAGGKMYYGSAGSPFISTRYWYKTLGAHGVLDCNNDEFCDLMSGYTKECWILNNDGGLTSDFITWYGTNLNECEGDCDSDADCNGNLKCYHDAMPPGCTGNYVTNADFCYDPSNSGKVLPVHPAFPMEPVVQPWGVDDYLLLLLVLMLVVNALTAAVMCIRKCCWRNSKAAVVVYDDDDKL